MSYKRFLIILIFVLLILLIPLIAMQLTNEVNWTLADFLLAGILLLTGAFTLDYVFRKVKNVKYRIILFIVILSVFLLVWAELAVGIFGTPIAGH